MHLHAEEKPLAPDVLRYAKNSNTSTITSNKFFALIMRRRLFCLQFALQQGLGIHREIWAELSTRQILHPETLHYACVVTAQHSH